MDDDSNYSYSCMTSSSLIRVVSCIDMPDTPQSSSHRYEYLVYVTDKKGYHDQVGCLPMFLGLIDLSKDCEAVSQKAGLLH